MGRSGGGHHGGGHSSYSHSHRRRGGRSKGKKTEVTLSESLIFTSIFLLIVIVVVAVVLAVDLSNGTPSYNYELSPKEQYLWCSDRKTKIKYSSTDIITYESMNGAPLLGNETREKRKTMTGHLSYSYKYQSFFMPPGSHLVAHKTSTSAITNFILINGWNNMKKFMDDELIYYIDKSSADDLEFTSDRFDEYFVVIDSKKSTDFTAEINVTLTTYDTDGLTERCTANTTKCTLNEEKNMNFCVILDYDVDNEVSYPNVKISFNDGTGGKIEGVTVTVLVIGGICIFAGVGVIIEAFIDHMFLPEKQKSDDISISDMFTENPKPQDGYSKNSTYTTDPEIEISEVGEKASYPVTSPSDIPSAVGPYPMGDPNYDTSYPTAPPPPQC